MKRDALISARKAQNLTQQDVANRARIKRSYYSLIETGDRNPSLPIAVKIAEALDVDLGQVFDREVFFAGRCYEMKRIEAQR